MKVYIELALKTLLVILIISLIIIFASISDIKEKLMQDKRIKSDINEGKYILNILANDYEKYLKRKRESLEKEKVDLFSEKNMQKTFSEKQKIENRLREIEIEKKALDEETKIFLKEKVEKEEKLATLKKEQKAYEKVISETNEDYVNLTKEKEQLESYWRNYVNDLMAFFTEEYEKDPIKKSLISEKFKTDNGKKYIFEEYNNLLKLSKLKVSKQEKFADDKIIKSESKEDSMITDKKTEGRNEEPKIDYNKITKIEKQTSKLEIEDKTKNYKYFVEHSSYPYTTDPEIINSFAEPILNAIENKKPDFEDDFSTNTGWDYGKGGGPVDSDQLPYRIIENGVLKKFSKDSWTNYFASNPKGYFKNFVLKIDVKPEINCMGTIGFWTRGQGSFYWIQIHHKDNRKFIFGYRNLSENKDYIIYIIPLLKNLILQSEESFKIILIVDKNYFAFFVNGKPHFFCLLNKAPTPSPYFGLGGLYNFNSEKKLVATFDNFAIWDLDKIMP